MPYILKKTDEPDARKRRYVAPAGSRHSYTAKPESARRFPDIESARADACGNETPVYVES